MTTSSERPAPGRLAVIQAFVNTRDIEAGSDALRTPIDLARWMAEHALLPAGTRLDAGDLDRAVALREALRSLLVAHSADMTPDRAAVSIVNAAAAAARLAPVVGPDGSSGIALDATGIDAA